MEQPGECVWTVRAMRLFCQINFTYCYDLLLSATTKRRANVGGYVSVSQSSGRCPARTAAVTTASRLRRPPSASASCSPHPRRHLQSLLRHARSPVPAPRSEIKLLFKPPGVWQPYVSTVATPRLNCASYYYTQWTVKNVAFYFWL